MDEKLPVPIRVSADEFIEKMRTIPEFTIFIDPFDRDLTLFVKKKGERYTEAFIAPVMERMPDVDYRIFMGQLRDACIFRGLIPEDAEWTPIYVSTSTKL